MSSNSIKISNTRVCLLIINYLSSEKTIQCVNCLLSEPINTIYILDNSENEFEEKELTSFINSTNDKNKEIRLIYLNYQENLGFSKGINKIIQYDKSSNNNHTHYCLLNNDTLPNNGFLQPLIDGLTDSNYSLVSPLITWGREQVSYNYYGVYSGLITKNNLPFSFPYVTGCCVAFSSKLVKNDNLLDEEFFMYGEDVDLCWRLNRKQKKIQVINESVIFHEGSGSAKNGSLFYEYHVARSHVLLIRKMHDIGIGLLFSYIGKSAFLLARALFRVFRNKKITPLKAYFMCWFNYNIRPEERSY